MKTRGFASCLGLLSALILFVGAPCADAEGQYHKWSVGLRGGPSILTQDAVDSLNVEGQVGPIFNGLVTYDLHKYFAFGFEVEWEQHKLDQAALTLGKASTASLLVRFEAHLERTQPISPYFLIAGGYNLNSFSEDDAYLSDCGQDCSIDIDNSFAIKAGFGVDMLVLFENAAINIEAAWKYNTANMDFFSGATQYGADDYNGNTLIIHLGFRYRFPVSEF